VHSKLKSCNKKEHKNKTSRKKGPYAYFLEPNYTIKCHTLLLRITKVRGRVRSSAAMLSATKHEYQIHLSAGALCNILYHGLFQSENGKYPHFLLCQIISSCG
jgi:hypothetical protein